LVIMVQPVGDDSIDRPRPGLEKKRSGCGRRPTRKGRRGRVKEKARGLRGEQAGSVQRELGKVVNVRNGLAWGVRMGSPGVRAGINLSSSSEKSGHTAISPIFQPERQHTPDPAGPCCSNPTIVAAACGHHSIVAVSALSLAAGQGGQRMKRPRRLSAHHSSSGLCDRTARVCFSAP